MATTVGAALAARRDKAGHRIRLVSWAVSQAPASSSRLPTLDPDGLYACSIVQARRGATNALGDVHIAIDAPSTFLHVGVPCIEDAVSGVMLAESIAAIETYSWKLAGRKGERSLLYECSSEEKDAAQLRHWAKSKALEQHILTNLHPLVHQSLFAKDVFAAHTARVYQSGLGIVARQSVPGRLRRSLQTLYAERGRNIDPASGLGPILREANTQREMTDEDRLEREDLAQRAGINIHAKRQQGGLMREEKEKAGRAFGQLKVVTFAEQVLGVVANQLDSQSFLSGQDRPSLLDLRLFSLLAPLLLPADQYPALATSPIAKVLRTSFPLLVEHTERIRLLLWPMRTSVGVNGKTIIETPDWPSLPGAERAAAEAAAAASPAAYEEPLSIRIAHNLGHLTSEAYLFTTRLSSRVIDSVAPAPAADANSTRSGAGGATTPRPTAMPSAEELREARMVAWGRYVWIATAVAGLIGTAFASGFIRIEFDDGEQEEESVLSEMNDGAESELAEELVVESIEEDPFETEQGEDVDDTETLYDDDDDDDDEGEDEDDDDDGINDDDDA